MAVKSNPNPRTMEQIKEHYAVEVELSDKLRNADKSSRRNLYTSLYDELYKRVPHHPQLTAVNDPKSRENEISRQINLIRRFLKPGSVFLEVGPGDCLLSIEMAKYAKKVYAVDVSTEITKGGEHPENFELIISDGCSVPVPANSIDMAYSNQLMEHLHSDDAIDQLGNIFKALSPNGLYICITPNRLMGPHDISKYFDKTAKGFHLKEYTFTELCVLFKKAGFSDIKALINIKGKCVKAPVILVKLYERIVDKVPYSLKKRFVRKMPFSILLKSIIVGTK